MQRHVCYDKLQKKKQREIDRAKRGSWNGVVPVTRRQDSGKTYRREKTQGWKDDSRLAFFAA